MNERISVFVLTATMAAVLGACGGGGGDDNGGDAGSEVSSSSTSSQSSQSSASASSDAPSSSSSSSSSAGSSVSSSSASSSSSTSNITTIGTAIPIASGPLRAASFGVSFTSSDISGSNYLGFVDVPYGTDLQLLAGDSGAFGTLPSGASIGQHAVLRSGIIDDVAGDGTFSIGRWTSGSFIDLARAGLFDIGPNQSLHYLVSKPFPSVTPDSNGKTLSCRQIAATKPTAVNGGVPVGSLSGSATFDTSTLEFSTTMFFTIGSDVDHGVQLSSKFDETGYMRGYMQAPFPAVVRAYLTGSSTASPIMAISYAIGLPNSGDVNGVAVFNCDGAAPKSALRAVKTPQRNSLINNLIAEPKKQ